MADALTLVFHCGLVVIDPFYCWLFFVSDGASFAGFITGVRVRHSALAVRVCRAASAGCWGYPAGEALCVPGTRHCARSRRAFSTNLLISNDIKNMLTSLKRTKGGHF